MRKYIMKKWFPGLMCSLVVLLIGFVFYSVTLKDNLEEESRANLRRCAAEIQNVSKGNFWEDNTSYYMIACGKNERGDEAYAILTREDKGYEIVQDSTNRMLVSYSMDWVDGSKWNAFYFCKQPEVRQIMEEKEKDFSGIFSDFSDKGYYWEVDDYYIHAKEIYIGHMAVVKNDTKAGEIKISGTYDFTPEDLEKKKHYEIEENNQMTISLLGTNDNGTAKAYLDNLVRKPIEEGTFQKESFQVMNQIHWEKGKIQILLSEPVRYIDDSYGQIYYVREYNLLKKHGFQLMVIFLIMAAVSFAIAMIMANRAAVMEKAQREMEEYRRELTNVMAHDLKNPLMNINGYAEILKANMYPEKQEYYLNEITSHVEYMNSLISNILELSQLEKGGIILTRSEADLVQVARKQLEKYEGNVEDNEFHLEIGGECLVEADPRLCDEMIENLISNALKYTSRGGGIKISGKENHFQITNDTLEIADTSAEELVKPFVKGNAARSEHMGNGIGLALVKYIAELHGFTIRVTSENGIFTVDLYA